MRQSEQLNELFSALCAVQGELRTVAMDSTNPHYRSSYASLESVVQTVNPVLSRHGLCLSQWVDGEALVSILGHKGGQWIASDYPIRPVKQDPQGVGSAITYARRYSAMSILGLAPEDDDGTAASTASKGKLRTEDKAPEQPKADTPAETSGNRRARMLAKVRDLANELDSIAEVGAARKVMMDTLKRTSDVATLNESELEQYGKVLKAKVDSIGKAAA